MIQRALKYLVPPIDDVVERERLAGALNLVLYTATTAWLTMVCYYYNISGLSSKAVVVGLVLVAFMVLCIIQVRRRRMLIPRIAVPLMMTAALTYLLAGYQGLHNNSILGYPLVILMGALFLGRGAAILFGALSFAGLVYLYWLEVTGRIKIIAFRPPDASDLLDMALLLSLIVALLWAIMTSMSKVVARARKSEEEIRRSRNMLAHILNSIPQSVFWKDAHGVFLGCNNVFSQTLGKERPEQVIGKTDLDFPGLRKEAERYGADDLEVMQGNRPKHHIIEPNNLPDGTCIWVDTSKVPLTDENGHAYGVLGISEDVTERRRAEEELRKREETIRALVETSRDWIWSLDLQEVHTYCNPATQSILGYAPEELVGKSSLDLVHEDDRELRGQQLNRSMAERRGWQNLLLRWRHKDGNWRYLESNATPMLGATGELAGFLGVDRDVTERRQLQEQLMQSQKMEAIGQLAGGVAHDFNNLLQAIIGYTDLVLGKLAADDANRPELEQVHLAGQKASTLTRQLLAFSRRQVIQPTTLNLNEVIAGLMKMLRRIIGEHIQLSISASQHLCAVHADQGQIEQVLMNLCVNARDAMPKGGRLSIETENVVFESDYRRAHPWVKVDRYVLLSVSDTGYGMDKETLQHVFEPFYTTKKPEEGTGLGLSMAYGIIQQHEGMIQAYSEVGVGTTFKVYLPISERPGPTGEDKTFDVARGGTETILLAEDEESILNLASLILREAGYTLFTACDGEAALRLFETHADKIDLVLLDAIMPRLGGYDVQKRISEKHPSVRFLFASGYSAHALHTNFVMQEGLHFIQKPYSRDALLRKVRDVLDG